MGLPGKAEIAEAYPGAKWPVAVDGKKRPKIKPIPYEPAHLAPRKKDIAGVLHVTGKGFLFINQFGRNVFSSGFAAFWWKGSLRIAGGKESLIRRWIWKTGRLGWGNGFWQFHDLSISSSAMN